MEIHNLVSGKPSKKARDAIEFYTWARNTVMW